MTKKDAERTLKQQSGNRCYLTRYSEGRRAYRLSVMERVSSSKQIVKHFKFTITYQSSDENVYALKGNDKKFPKVSEMLQYFRNSAVSHQLSNIGVPVVYQTGETTNPDNGESVVCLPNYALLPHQACTLSIPLYVMFICSSAHIFSCQLGCLESVEWNTGMTFILKSDVWGCYELVEG